MPPHTFLRCGLFRFDRIINKLSSRRITHEPPGHKRRPAASCSTIAAPPPNPPKIPSRTKEFALAWRRGRYGGGGRLRLRRSSPDRMLDDERMWGPTGDLPAAHQTQPHHPPLLRRVAATAERDPRRRGLPLLQRSVSVGHSEHHHVHHHHVHHVHHHHYYAMPRQTWEAPRFMPVLRDERGDWDSVGADMPALDRGLDRGLDRAFDRGLDRPRRRMPAVVRWLTARRSHVAEHDDAFDFSYEELIELDARNVCRGLSPDELSGLGGFSPTAEHVGQDCHICLDSVEEDNTLVQIKCGHLFHQQCIHTWLKLKRTCPICRCEL